MIVPLETSFIRYAWVDGYGNQSGNQGLTNRQLYLSGSCAFEMLLRCTTTTWLSIDHWKVLAKLASSSRNTSFSSQVDQFDIEAVKLQSLKKIRIGHDGSGPGAGWFLDKVVITDPTDPGKEYNFPCERCSPMTAKLLIRWVYFSRMFLKRLFLRFVVFMRSNE